MKLLIVFFAACTVLFSGCATIVSESEYPVRLSSTPSANFVIFNRSGFEVASGVTPDTIILPAGDGFFRSGQYTIEYSQPGFASKTVQLRPTVDGWVFGNILLGGIIGLVIDGATGAIYALPNSTNVRLDQLKLDVSQLDILNYADLTDAEKAELVLL